MSSTIVLKAQQRETGKKAARKARQAGLVPGVVYKNGEPGLPILCHPLSLRPIVYTSETHMVDVHVEGHSEVLHAVLKDISFDPVTDKIVHFDLLGVTKDHGITVDVPVVVKGRSKGEAEGGIVHQELHKLHVRCLPDALPEHIEVDVTELNIGQAVHIGDIRHDNFEIIGAAEAVVVSILAPKVSESAE